MKSVITAICLLISLVIIFVIISHKDFYPGDEVAIQQETVTGKKPVTVSTLKPVEQLAESKPVEVKTTETKPVETKPIAEMKPVVETTSVEAKPVEKTSSASATATADKNQETESNEIKPVTDTVTDLIEVSQLTSQNKPVSQDNLIPIAVPLVTPEEAMKINAEALELSKPLLVLSERKRKGYKQVVSYKFKQLSGIYVSKYHEKQLTEKGYDINSFKQRMVPASWTIDLETLPAGAIFQQKDNGYNLCATKGSIRILGPKYDCMKSSFFFDAVIKNESDENDCSIKLGIYDSGNAQNGYHVLKEETIAPGKEKNVQWETSIYDLYLNVSPTISINGDAVLKDLSVYRLDHPEFTIVEGTVRERSALPDPETTDYPDCRYTVHFVGNSIVSGNSINKEIVLSVDGFKNKQVLPSNKLKKGDKIKCAVVRFDAVPETMSGIQEADDLTLFDLDSYLLTTYETVSSFSDYSETSLGIDFSDFKREKKEYISIFDRKINPDLSSDLKYAQQKAVKDDLDRINALLQPYTEERKKELNSEFKKEWETEKKKDRPGYNRIDYPGTALGTRVWRNVDNSFYALPESYEIIQEEYSGISQENLKSLVAFKDFLEANGIQLILSIVPDFYDISARVIMRKYHDLPDFKTVYLVKQLLENNIEAIYASDAIIANYNKYENAFFYPQDPHPGDLIQDILSSILAERISRFKFPRQMQKEDFQIVRRPNPILNVALKNRSYPSNCDIGDHQPGDPYLTHTILYKNQSLKSAPDSPVFLLGNSFSYTPEHISHYLSMKSGIDIYHYSIAGFGVLSSAFQRFFNNPESFLKNRKVFILSLGAIHFLSNIAIPNMKELDLEVRVIQNKQKMRDFELSGNDQTLPKMAMQLSNPTIFKTDTNGFSTILADADIASAINMTDESYLVITYCCETNDCFKLDINGSICSLTGSDHVYLWSKKVIPVPKGTKQITIKAKGNKNAFIAIESIQIYQ